jgi:cAMP-binding proteins - catabolite gene activator and regulatory subunit of cAMP-dependent protein kinases
LGWWGPGDVVGQTALQNAILIQIECLTKVEATLLSLDRGLNREVLLYHLQQAEDLTIIRAGKRVFDSMLDQLLTWLAKKFGSEVKQGHLIDLGLTHQDIAELLGISRVTVTRTLGIFEQQGVIQRLSIHRIILQDSEVWHYEI